MTVKPQQLAEGLLVRVRAEILPILSRFQVDNFLLNIMHEPQTVQWGKYLNLETVYLL